MPGKGIGCRVVHVGSFRSRGPRAPGGPACRHPPGQRPHHPRPASAPPFPPPRELVERLREEAEQAQSNDDLVRRFVEACRRTRTILPATTTIERLCADALVDAERRGSNSADANRLLDRREHLQRLDVPEGLFQRDPSASDPLNHVLGAAPSAAGPPRRDRRPSWRDWLGAHAKPKATIGYDAGGWPSSGGPSTTRPSNRCTSRPACWA